ncbi:hypothetical protein V1951_23690, partial [Yersinia sp. 2544 StPb PI]|uniref:hypothetical protein n=1 Tax=Yersinia sp. 2544 StPb PI TaxID=3117409 RepID=UPI003B28B005
CYFSGFYVFYYGFGGVVFRIYWGAIFILIAVELTIVTEGVTCCYFFVAIISATVLYLFLFQVTDTMLNAFSV